MSASLSQLPLERRWQAQRHPMPSVAALIRQHTADGVQYVLIKRIKEPYIGQWALVGGKWDFGETLEQAVCREVLEETGLQTRFRTLHGVVNERLHPAAATEQGGHFLLFVCGLEVVSGEAREQDEGAVGWFSMEALEAQHRRQALVPTDYHLLTYYHQQNHPLQYIEADVAAGQDGSSRLVLARFEASA